jgi:hypothetical protein
LVSFGDCVVCPSIYGSWLSLWYLLVIVLSVLLFTVPGYPLGKEKSVEYLLLRSNNKLKANDIWRVTNKPESMSNQGLTIAN